MTELAWWMKGIIYEIYPRSFQDSGDDGIGDLPGIRRRLEYFNQLGIDAIWIAPIFTSPMADFGYDVSNYCGVDRIFGSIEDFDSLLHDAHSHGLKVILDFVPNHSSDQHPWFVQSRSSKEAPKRDWYIWHGGVAGKPPNNWVSQFGGSAWTFDKKSGQYYLHSFLREQPDLNWRNQSVRSAMYDAMRFWLERGVDGFRVDVLWLLIKDAELRDNPPNPNFRTGDAEINRFLNIHNGDQIEVHEIVSQMRAVIEEYTDRVLIGEIYLPIERLVTYYGDGKGAQLPFNFQLINAPWSASHIAKLVEDYEKALPIDGWPNWVLGNHDQPRIAHRVGEAQARIAAMLILTLRGTPTLYYGDELGLGDVPIPPDKVQDPWEHREPGLGLGRDRSRTPFQWDQTANAGFTEGNPWLPLDPDYRNRNVQVLVQDSNSILNLYGDLIALRRRHKSLVTGRFNTVLVKGDAFIYSRTEGAERIVVALNFGNQEQDIAEACEVANSRIIVSTSKILDFKTAKVTSLRPNEGIVLWSTSIDHQ
jgi:alpha-glucosidase